MNEAAAAQINKSNKTSARVPTTLNEQFQFIKPQQIKHSRRISYKFVRVSHRILFSSTHTPKEIKQNIILHN